VAHSDHYLADWLRRSEALRARMPDHLNLVYGDAPRTRLDFFATKRPGAPTLVFFHGGYWQRNTKEGFGFVGEERPWIPCRGRGLHLGTRGYDGRNCSRGTHRAALAPSEGRDIGR
jgi:arylformamidase